MKLYHALTQCRFLYRVNRFMAVCLVDGRETDVHVKNTGRLGELLLKDTVCYVEKSDAAHRKTAYDLVAVEKDSRVVNIDSQAANPIVREWLLSGRYAPDMEELRSEVTHGDSRFDFGYRRGEVQGLIEVKGVTLFDEGGVAFFPDAPTQRGVKHIEGLIRAAQSGMEAGVIFVLQREDAVALRPNMRTHPEFGRALSRAKAAGVRLTAAVCRVTPDSSTIVGEVPVMTE